ncbi:hypothetical protein Pres01_52000 [Metapseudomonas resinovorans]|nr:hypothetical protein Pres01_52000 [Pseudomonas resinovorans]
MRRANRFLHSAIESIGSVTIVFVGHVGFSLAELRSAGMVSGSLHSVGALGHLDLGGLAHREGAEDL